MAVKKAVPAKKTAVKAVKTTAAKKTTPAVAPAKAAAGGAGSGRVTPAGARKFAPAKPVKVDDDTVTTPATESATATSEGSQSDMPATTIPFRDRELLVRFPKPEQLVIINRVVKQFSSLDPNASMPMDKALALLDRGMKVITALVVNQSDKDWLDDLMLTGDLELAELAPLFVGSIRKMREQTVPNRAARRGTKSSPSASRRR